MASTSTQIVIQDTCILLDLVELNLLDAFFQLGFQVYTTPHVTSEIIHEIQWNQIIHYIDKGLLLMDSEGSVESIILIVDANNGLSFADGSVFELGLRKKGIILSSDRSLRKCCEKAEIQVHGMLWIIEKLHTTGKIDRDFACNCLQHYSNINSWSPRTQITNLIETIMAYTN